MMYDSVEGQHGICERRDGLLDLLEDHGRQATAWDREWIDGQLSVLLGARTEGGTIVIADHAVTVRPDHWWESLVHAYLDLQARPQ